ncbi:MAG: adenosylmethionine decarboxylase [Holophaga sp.]|nr:adenosylmethionine decarboxylase [Holophaga sp.]
MQALGRHLLAELKGCEAARLSDLPLVQESMLQAARVSGATIVTQSFHHFAPLGISGVVVVAESHLAIHTWPEHCFAALDYFTCGQTVDPLLAIDYLRVALGAEQVSLREILRGEL